jgi:hypothetical protein
MNIFMILLFLVSGVNAHASPNCAVRFNAKPIPHTPQPVYPQELEHSGTITFPGQPLPHLGPGHYIYLITGAGELLTSLRYLPTARGKNIATHKSLLKMYRRETGRSGEDSIIASGEFQMGFDEVIELKNKSGNFRGDPASLEVAEQVFRASGLPLKPTTKLSPVSAEDLEDRGHTPNDRSVDEFRVSVISEVHGTPRGRKLIEIYNRMYHLMHETFPSHPGMLAIEDVMTAALKGSAVTGRLNGYHALTYPLQEIYTPDGLEYGIWSIEHSDTGGRGQDGFEEGASVQCLNVIVGMGTKMDPRLTQSWTRLADDFSSLKNL